MTFSQLSNDLSKNPVITSVANYSASVPAFRSDTSNVIGACKSPHSTHNNSRDVAISNVVPA